MPSRRQFLSALGASVLGAVAGCTGSPDAPPAATTPDLDPEKHVAGADGHWSSFGCNAANTHEVHDGQAPVDGVTERWRVAVPATQYVYGPPVVADGCVYLPGEEMRVFDAADGSELWQTGGVGTAPVVRDGVVYASDTDADTIVALDAATGEPRWTKSVDATPKGPSMYPGRPLVVGAGETVHAFDPDTGDRRWTREVFGTVRSHPPIFKGTFVAVATAAGELSLLWLDDGRGARRWRLPSAPAGPASVDTDSIYLNCENGTTYALGGDNTPRGQVVWRAETGVSSNGIGVAAGLVLAGTAGALHAVDAESGEIQWTHDIGDWDGTAPAVGRDTLFVGGDRLWALDPTSGDSLLASGPGVRFDRTFHGRVGTGPVLDDGTLYVVAETGSESYHLIALN